MMFHSILFQGPDDGKSKETPQAPEFFVDLNLDQIIDAITAGKEEYDLKPFFYAPLQDISAVHYRHGIFQDLANPLLLEHIQLFAKQMRFTREHLAQAAKLYHKFQKYSWFLDAVEIYCDAIVRLVYDLSLAEIRSTGFLAFRDYVNYYAQLAPFRELLAATKKLKADLSTVNYCILKKGNGFKVRKYESEIDYSAEVEEAFAKFKQGAVKSYRAKFGSQPTMNSTEEKVLDFVALLYPDIFSNLDAYCANNHNYLDRRIGRFDREVQFYLSYLEYIERFKRSGHNFCYPQISDECKEVYDSEAFDLALAHKLIRERSASLDQRVGAICGVGI
jgi:DNA mismatch repair protein MutS